MEKTSLHEGRVEELHGVHGALRHESMILPYCTVEYNLSLFHFISLACGRTHRYSIYHE